MSVVVREARLWEVVKAARDRDPYFSNVRLGTLGLSMNATQVHYGVHEDGVKDEDVYVSELIADGDISEPLLKALSEKGTPLDGFETVWWAENGKTYIYVNPVSLQGTPLSEQLDAIKDKLNSIEQAL